LRLRRSKIRPVVELVLVILTRGSRRDVHCGGLCSGSAVCFAEGKSRREAARIFGLSRETVSKMCRYSMLPGYRRETPSNKPKLGPFIPVIEAILETDRTAPVKQRHTAKRIFERLRDEHGFGGGYTVVKDHVRIARSRGRETFVPLAHPPGHAQVDFGEAVGVIGGVPISSAWTCRNRMPAS